jgi:hypothetical protein
MTAASHTANGRPQRKQLSDQLDRLDGIIDCLAEALPQAVADATREGTRQALRQIFVELLSDPEILSRLRAALAPMMTDHASVTPSPSPPEIVPAGPFARLKSSLRRAVGTVGTVVTAGARSLGGTLKQATVRVREAGSRASAAVHTLRSGMPVGRFALVAVGVGVTVAAVSFAAPKTFAAAVSGLAAASTAILIQVGHWLRRSVQSLGLGAA